MSNTRHRLVFCGLTLGQGGAENQLARLAAELADRFDISVLTGRRQKALEPPPGVEVKCLVNSDGQYQRIARSFRAVSTCRLLSADLIYSRFPPFNLALARARASGHLDCPVVVQEVVEPSLHFCNDLQSWLVGKAMRRYYPGADLVLGNGRRVVRDLVDNFGVDARRCRYLPNLAPRSEAREPSGGDRHQLEVLAIGRLERQKGFSDLIEAFRRVSDRVENLHLTIAGVGSLADQLAQQVQRAGLTQRVRFTGWVEDPERLLRRADVLVSSSHYEGMSNAVMEAMAQGLPVLTTEVSGSLELLRPEQDGLVVPPADPSALASGLLRLIRDRTLRENLARAARSRIELFRSDRVAADYGRAFHTLIETGVVA